MITDVNREELSRGVKLFFGGSIKQWDGSGHGLVWLSANETADWATGGLISSDPVEGFSPAVGADGGAFLGLALTFAR